MPSSRRQLLASLGVGLAGLAGCNAAPDDGTPADPTPSDTTGTPTPTPTSTALGDTATVDGVSVTVSDLVDAHSFLYLSAPDAFGVTVADGQFAFVTVDAGGDAPPAPDAFALTFDGKRRTATTYRDYGPAGDLPVPDTEYATDDPRGYLGFEIPAPLDADSVAVALDDAVRWTVPESELAPLRSPPPSFAVEYDVPDVVARDEAIPVSLSIANEGDGRGTFRGALNHEGPLYGASDFAVTLDAGESTTHEERITYHRQEGFSSDRLRFTVVSAAGERSFEVGLGTGSDGGTATPSGTTTATDTATSPTSSG
ncbi:MAG: hypothetical protein ABEJ78_06330 [Haloferacaceae archaeon]